MSTSIKPNCLWNWRNLIPKMSTVIVPAEVPPVSDDVEQLRKAFEGFFQNISNSCKKLLLTAMHFNMIYIWMSNESLIHVSISISSLSCSCSCSCSCVREFVAFFFIFWSIYICIHEMTVIQERSLAILYIWG